MLNNPSSQNKLHGEHWDAHLQQARTKALLRAKILLLGLQLRPHVLSALPFSHPGRELQQV